MATYTRPFIVPFGTGKKGLSTVGYALYNANHTLNASRTTTGVYETIANTTGCYVIGSVTLDTSFAGYIEWDTGDAVKFYAQEDIQQVSTVTQNIVLPSVSTGEKIKVKQDSRDQWVFSIVDANAVVIPLTAFVSVTISMWLKKGAAMKISSATATITDALNGLVAYNPTANDVNTAGAYELDLTFTDAGGKIYVYGSLDIEIVTRVK
jgi:hypothetical protein